MMVTLPVRVPLTVGVKVTPSVHDPPALRPPPQLSDTAKSPLAVILVTPKSMVPVLLRVICCVVLVMPRSNNSKTSEV